MMFVQIIFVYLVLCALLGAARAEYNDTVIYIPDLYAVTVAITSPSAGYTYEFREYYSYWLDMWRADGNASDAHSVNIYDIYNVIISLSNLLTPLHLLIFPFISPLYLPFISPLYLSPLSLSFISLLYLSPFISPSPS